MAERKKRRRDGKGASGGQKLLALVLGAMLVLFAGSITVGVMNRITRAPGGEITVPVRLEVLNGTGESGLGRVVARALMKKRVDVLLVANADDFDYPQTILIARKRKPEIESLAEQLGCTRVVEQLKDDALVDATLIIGDDYKRLDLGLED
jgi:hypothetical protein